MRRNARGRPRNSRHIRNTALENRVREVLESQDAPVERIDEVFEVEGRDTHVRAPARRNSRGRLRNSRRTPRRTVQDGQESQDGFLQRTDYRFPDFPEVDLGNNETQEVVGIHAVEERENTPERSINNLSNQNVDLQSNLREIEAAQNDFLEVIENEEVLNINNLEFNEDYRQFDNNCTAVERNGTDLMNGITDAVSDYMNDDGTLLLLNFYNY